VRESAKKTRAGLQGRKVKSVVGTGVDYEINPYAISVWLGYLIPLFGVALRVQSVSPPKSGRGRPDRGVVPPGQWAWIAPNGAGRQEMLAYAQIGEISAGIGALARQCNIALTVQLQMVPTTSVRRLALTVVDKLS
jgi:hypothetical protein